MKSESKLHPELGYTGRSVTQRILNVLFFYPTDTFEFSGACTTLGWGLMVIQSGRQITTPEIYDLMTGNIPEWAWAVSMICVAFFLFFGLLFDKFQPVRTYAAVTAAFAWVTLAYCYSYGPHAPTTAAVMYGSPAFFWVLTAVRLYYIRKWFGSSRQRFRFARRAPFFRISGGSDPERSTEHTSPHTQFPQPDGDA